MFYVFIHNKLLLVSSQSLHLPIGIRPGLQCRWLTWFNTFVVFLISAESLVSYKKVFILYFFFILSIVSCAIIITSQILFSSFFLHFNDCLKSNSLSGLNLEIQVG